MMLKTWVSSLGLFWFFGIAQVPTDAPQTLGVLARGVSPVLSVPGGSNASPTLDGRLNPGEWDDALRVSNGSLTLYLKTIRDDVYLAVDCHYSPNPGVDLFICDEGSAKVLQLQVRDEARERALPSLEPQRFALDKGWIMPSGWAAAAVTGDAPVPPGCPHGPAGLPSPGVELKIEASKFPRRLWSVRLELTIPEAAGRSLEFPQQTAGDDGLRWLTFFVSR